MEKLYGGLAREIGRVRAEVFEQAEQVRVVDRLTGRLMDVMAARDPGFDRFKFLREVDAEAGAVLEAAEAKASAEEGS